jgi:hypothetical protein
MCDFIMGPMAAMFGGGGAATAAGAAAAAGTGMSALSGLGMILSVTGQLAQISAQNAALDAQEAALAQQQETEKQMNAIEDARTRAEMKSQMRQQSAELIARGVDLSSPTAVRLGATAAREMSFASQRVRSEGRARQIELQSQRDIVKARKATNTAKGIFTVADTFITAAPQVWPELLA